MKTNHASLVREPAARWLLAAGLAILYLVRATTCCASPTVTHVACGWDHTLFVLSDGSLWGMGNNFVGQLGIGFVPGRTNVPQMIVASNVTAVAAGDEFSLFRKSDGSLWAMGNNAYGQLGDGSTNNHYFPEQIVTNGVTVIGAGSQHSIFGQFRFPLGPGALVAMGNNSCGQLGDGTINSTNKPKAILSTPITGGQTVTSVAAGLNYSFFIRPGGSLWAMGYNNYGQLGDGGTNDQHSPEQIVSANVTAVATGVDHTLYVKSDGSLWAFGNNNFYQLGDNTINNRHTPEQVGINVVAVAAGDQYSLFIKSDGSLWGMGFNWAGEMGLGDTPIYVPVPVMIVASNVVAVATGLSHSMFIKSDGSLWSMGYNVDGELGNHSYFSEYTPVQIVAPPFSITGIKLAAPNLILNGSNGKSGGSYATLMTTNLTLPLNQWKPVATNKLSADGNFTITVTNAVQSQARQFYTLLLQN